MNNKISQFVFTVLVIAAAPLSQASAAWNETHVYGVAEFGDSGQCGSSSSTHTASSMAARSKRRIALVNQVSRLRFSPCLIRLFI